MDSDSTLFSLTLRAGLASRTTLHLFELARFSAMLWSPSGFPSREGPCPKGIALTLPGLQPESRLTFTRRTRGSYLW